MTIILTIIVFIVVLGLLIFVHEFGHFGAAKIFGVKVEEFGFGYPPRIWGKKIGLTLYSLNWIPIGGFCKIKGVVGGDQASDSKKKDNFKGSDTFIGQPIWQRFLILAAGVIMNIALATILISFGYVIGLPDNLENLPASARVSQPQVMIYYVGANTPASQAELKAGDIITKINQQEFTSIAALNDYNNSLDNPTINLTVDREGQEINTKLTLTQLPESDRIGLGVYLTETGTVSYPWYTAFYYGAKKTFLMLWYILLAFYGLIQQIFATGQVSADLSGPVGIAVYTNEVTQRGFIYIIQFAALLSLNLAILNFLPFPALDGGRVIFLLIEAVRRKPVSQKIENLIHNLGFALLIILLIMVTFRDIGKFF